MKIRVWHGASSYEGFAITAESPEEELHLGEMHWSLTDKGLKFLSAEPWTPATDHPIPTRELIIPSTFS